MERSSFHRSQHTASQASPSNPVTPGHVSLIVPRRSAERSNNRRRELSCRALPELLNLDIHTLATSISHSLTLGYEPVVLPCSSMNCGDITYRSTLDPVLRMEKRVLTPQGLALLAASLSYLLAKPGVLSGLVDTYFSAPFERLRAKVYAKEDFDVGRKIATGGFGTVYLADLVDPDTGKVDPVVVKKATEFGEAEVWMNERMTRAAPQYAARFITAFSDGDGRPGDPLWLVWAFEGSNTLAELMTRRDFPNCLEPLLFDRQLNIPEGPDRRAAVIRAAIRQLIEAVQACHNCGIVHRDVKPQNCIVSEADRRVKLIDFGAAADLRIGINYVPNQYLLDPRYAPPEQYIMSSQTPRAPPAPVAAFLSPVLWQLNGPDRFDMYSVGITLLQLALPPLRSDNALVTFNRALAEQHGSDLQRWREATERRGGREWAEGFATLDALGGGGWDLARQLVQYKASDRLSAAGALAHPWFDPSPLEAVASGVENLGRVAAKVTEADDGWLQRQMSKSGTFEAGGFTEAQLKDELGFRTLGERKQGLPAEMANSSATVAWWQQRQSEVQSRLKERQKKPVAVNGKVKLSSEKMGASKEKKGLKKFGLFDMDGAKGRSKK